MDSVTSVTSFVPHCPNSVIRLHTKLVTVRSIVPCGSSSASRSGSIAPRPRHSPISNGGTPSHLVVTPQGFSHLDEPSNYLGIFHLAARPLCFAVGAPGDRLAAAELRQYRFYAGVCRLLAGACD